MPVARSRPADGRREGWQRATTPAVGVVVMLAVTALLASTVTLALGIGGVTTEPAPAVGASASLTAADGWPDGQVVTLTHEAGEAVPVAEIALVLSLERRAEPVRLTGFPTRRLTAEHVDGPAVVDRSYAGVDGAVDAAHTDGRWESAEQLGIRIASTDYDIHVGETVGIRVVHQPSKAVIIERRVRATSV